MALAKGVLPDDVIRDHRSEAVLLFVRLRPDLSQEGVQQWLARASEVVAAVVAPQGVQRTASIATALGRSFFIDLATGGPRFGLEGRIPLGLASPPAVPMGEDLSGWDILFYVLTTSEATAARFLQGIGATGPLGLERIRLERGFQRSDRRELFGFLDGVRNAPWPHRYRITFVDRERTADEPDWTEDGTYLAYLKIRQRSEQWDQVSVQDQERVIGRFKEDGSRLDAPGTEPKEEPTAFREDLIPPSSHVRKAGPHPDDPEETAIFRRGVPYLEVNTEGRLEGGLHFVSFQHSLDAFHAVFNAWMMNEGFPVPGAGRDALLGFVDILHHGFFFVPPPDPDGRHIGAQIFDPPEREPRPREVGRIFVRKRAVDASGAKIATDLRGVTFQVLKASDRSPVGGAFATNAEGHALSDDLPVREDLILQEVSAPPNLVPSGELPVRIEHRRKVIEVTNQVRQPGTY
jgi:Dyp-type peroxidase family